MTDHNTATVLDFLRHGEVQGGQYYRGRTDDPLTEQGWRQMHRQCADGQWDVVVSSPLRRCRSFASAWRQQQPCCLRIDAAWREIDFGDWEGQTAEQITAKSPDALQRFYADPVGYTPPNAESYADFSARVALGLEEVLTTYEGQRLLIVTHAGVIRVLFSLLLGIPAEKSWQIDVPHACLSRFSCFQESSARFMQLNFHKAG